MIRKYTFIYIKLYLFMILFTKIYNLVLIFRCPSQSFELVNVVPIWEKTSSSVILYFLQMTAIYEEKNRKWTINYIYINNFT